MRVNNFFILLILLIIPSTSFAIQIGQATPQITVYRPCETRVVVYDARPELGIGMNDMGKTSRDIVNALGVRLVRHTLYWNRMETTDKPGLYDSKYLTEWENLIDNCRKEGVYLEVLVQGDPPGLTYADRKTGYERFARFVTDMASRYPSIIYWELMNSDSTCLFGAGDSIYKREQGKNYAEMLKIVYPAIKSANPAAWVLCGSINDATDFPQGIYENDGGRYFDIMNLCTYGTPAVSAFMDRGKSIRKVMMDNGDENKPLWNTGIGMDAGNTVEMKLEDYQNCFEINNASRMYNKVLPSLELTVDDPVYKWLDDLQPNAAIARKSRAVVNVFVPMKAPMIPVGYDYAVKDGGIEIQRVTVDSLVPTTIDLIYAAEPASLKPGEKAAPAKNKGNSRPIPDPFDL